MPNQSSTTPNGPPSRPLAQKLETLAQHPELFTSLGHGIEKESLRVTPAGKLASGPHPAALGSALTHPQITTDFSEAQPELITGVHDSADACLAELDDIHRFVHANLDNELLWSASMPCMLGQNSDIPVGRYGTTNIARAKTVYRVGLGNRYGRLMQTISGIHYNFSLPDSAWSAYAEAQGAPAGPTTASKGYLDLVRNFRRHSWLLIYLFGASPALCRSFIKDGTTHNLDAFDKGTLYLPHATSLRMGRLGYRSDAQSNLHVSYNTVDDYAATLREGLSTSYPPYEAYATGQAGDYQQLNTCLLQIENEFYGTIRPKRTTQTGERPISALLDRGVEYVEVRCLDVNPFLPSGIDAIQARFIDTFLLACLLRDSPRDKPDDTACLSANQLTIVERGRQPGLELQRDGKSVPMQEWARELLDDCMAIAQVIDAQNGDDLHSYAVECQSKKLVDSELTPSARILQLMRDQDIPFYRFAMNQSLAHKGYFADHPLRESQLQDYVHTARTSITKQAEMEAATDESFEAFLEHYLAIP